MLRRAWRRLWATPIFTVFAVASLALGVGVTAAIYSVVVSITRNPIDVPNSDRIGIVVGTDPIEGRRQTWRSLVSRADFDDLAQASSTVGQLVASAAFYQSIVDGPVSEAVLGEAVTGHYFSFLGLTPNQGRLIQPSDDTAPARIAVMGHHFWRSRYAADPDIVGHVVRIGGEPFQIVGIAPEDFGGLSNRIQSSTVVWVPLGSTTMFPSSAAPPKDPSDRRRRQLSVLIVPGPAASMEAVSAEVGASGSRLDVAFPIDMRRADASGPQVQPRAWSVQTLAAANRELDSQFALAEAVVVGIVGLVLVVACTNLANLVLARGSSRLHEVAVRRALGASRQRLVVEQLAETGWLAVMGAIGAFIVTRLLLTWFTSATIPISEAAFVQLEPRLDVATLTLAAAAVLASLVVFGLAPALQLTRVQLRPALAAEGGSTGQLRWRTRRTLIAVQVMISLSFFLMAAFGVRAVSGERARPSGIDVEKLAIGMLNLHLPPWTEVSAREAIDHMMTIAPAQPALETAAVVSGMPFGTNYTPGADLTRIDKPFLPGKTGYPSARLIAATPSVFTTIGVPVLNGRAFDGRDAAGATAVAVISEVTARQIFGSTDVLGREFLWRHELARPDGNPVRTLTVIGVAGDTDTQQRRSRESGTVWVPLSQNYEPYLALVGRAKGDPEDAIGELKALAQQAHPDLVLDRPGTAELVLNGQYVLISVVSRLAGGLALLAMLLGMAGLFGVLSHIVSRRTREMGLRIALGAEPRQIRQLVVREGLQPVISGLIMGFLIAVAARLMIQSSRPLTTADLLVFVLAPLPIIVAALAACYWPALRASRVSPNEALKEL